MKGPSTCNVVSLLSISNLFRTKLPFLMALNVYRYPSIFIDEVLPLKTFVKIILFILVD